MADSRDEDSQVIVLHVLDANIDGIFGTVAKKEEGRSILC